MSDIVDAFRFLLIWFGTMVLLWLGFYFFEQYLMNTFFFESVPILGLVTRFYFESFFINADNGSLC